MSEVLERARDRQTTQYSKYEAAIEYQVFYTDQGVDNRKQKIKLRVFSNKQEKLPAEGGVDQSKDEQAVERYMRMLQVHNSKVDKIRNGYTTYCHQRQQAIVEGVSIEEI